HHQYPHPSPTRRSSDLGNQADLAERPQTWREEATPAVSRIAFVSGGMGGIGTAICRRLGRAGHTVVAGCLPGYERKADWLAGMRDRKSTRLNSSHVKIS